MKVRYETRSKRKARQRWLKAGIWLFIVVFAFSVVGTLIAFVSVGSH
jgi:heme/copper-type cytochrome/quinol oxidase subunit 4